MSGVRGLVVLILLHGIYSKSWVGTAFTPATVPRLELTLLLSLDGRL